MLTVPHDGFPAGILSPNSIQKSKFWTYFPFSSFFKNTDCSPALPVARTQGPCLSSPCGSKFAASHRNWTSPKHFYPAVAHHCPGDSWELSLVTQFNPPWEQSLSENCWRFAVGNWEGQDQFKYSEPQKFGSRLVLSKGHFPWLAWAHTAELLEH